MSAEEMQALIAADRVLFASCVAEGNRVNRARYIPVVLRMPYCDCLLLLHDTVLLVLSRS